MIRIKTHKSYGKHPDIGWWFAINIIPTFGFTRSCDFITQKPVWEFSIMWLFWIIRINSNKSY